MGILSRLVSLAIVASIGASLCEADCGVHKHCPNETTCLTNRLQEWSSGRSHRRLPETGEGLEDISPIASGVPKPAKRRRLGDRRKGQGGPPKASRRGVRTANPTGK